MQYRWAFNQNYDIINPIIMQWTNSTRPQCRSQFVLSWSEIFSTLLLRVMLRRKHSSGR